MNKTLSCEIGECIAIGPITVVVVSIDRDEIQLGIVTPEEGMEQFKRLAKHEGALVVRNHRVGQALGDSKDARDQALLPDRVWGDGKPQGVQRAGEEMIAAVHALPKRSKMPAHIWNDATQPLPYPERMGNKGSTAGRGRQEYGDSEAWAW